MDYHHRFIIKAPLEEVLAFHSSASSLPAITPWGTCGDFAIIVD
jgi:ligand-binding SRPBCC domain-containing protein